MNIKNTIVEIENNDGTFPKRQLEYLINSHKQAIPMLLEVLENTIENTHEVLNNGDFYGHIYATFLLAQFREIKGYPLIYELISRGEPVSYGKTICTEY